MELTAAAFVFLALGTAGVLLLTQPRSKGQSSDERVRALGASEPVELAVPALATRPFRSSMPALRRWIEESSWAERAATDLRRANIKLRVAEYLLVRVLVGATLAAIPFMVAPNVVGIILAGLAGIVGFFVPAFYLRRARGKRVARIEQQLIEFLPALASSLRSGFAFTPAVESAAQQMSAPLGDELAILLNDMSLGADSPTALRELGERVGSRDLDMLITALQVQRTTGGNLPEILDATAAALRDRERIRGDVQTFTAQQRMTGLILSVYPVAVGLLLLAIMPSVWSKLFTEPVGQIQLGVALVLQIVGFLAIQRSLKIDV